jgi:hypothetical protein
MIDIQGSAVSKSMSSVLCINSAPSLKQDLQHKGFATPDRKRYLGIELAKTIEDTVRETMQRIDMKAIKRIILCHYPTYRHHPQGDPN